MQIASKLIFFLLITCWPYTANAESCIEKHLHEIEVTLLHRRLDLSSGIVCRESAGVWAPLVLQPTKVYVVNLWSIGCRSCIEEFPILSKVVRGWRENTKISFLFIADTSDGVLVDEIEHFWDNSVSILAQGRLCRTTNSRIRNALETSIQPLTLLLDEFFIIRQVFAGAVNNHSLGASIERLFSAVLFNAKSCGTVKILKQ